MKLSGTDQGDRRNSVRALNIAVPGHFPVNSRPAPRHSYGEEGFGGQACSRPFLCCGEEFCCGVSWVPLELIGGHCPFSSSLLVILNFLFSFLSNRFLSSPLISGPLSLACNLFMFSCFRCAALLSDMRTRAADWSNLY